MEKPHSCENEGFLNAGSSATLFDVLKNRLPIGSFGSRKAQIFRCFFKRIDGLILEYLQELSAGGMNVCRDPGIQKAARELLFALFQHPVSSVRNRVSSPVGIEDGV